MNYYFLVEGKKTEMLFYPIMIKWLDPKYKRVNSIEEISKNTFYMFSGLGYPNIFKKIKNALKDIEDFNAQSKHTQVCIDILFIVIDADIHGSYEKALKAFNDRLKKYSDDIRKAKVKVIPIIQQQCIESWFLGNPNIIPSVVVGKLKKYVDYYNVSVQDPELMLSNNEKTNGQYAFSYLQETVKQNGAMYNKSNLDFVSSNEYIQAIYKRCYETKQLQSFKCLVDTLKKYNDLDHL